MTSYSPARAVSHRLEDLLSGLLAENSLPDDCANTAITGIATDSREVLPGDLFIALNGFTVDGRTYINEAICLPSILSSFLPLYLPSFLSSVLPIFLPVFLPSFLGNLEICA